MCFQPVIALWLKRDERNVLDSLVTEMMEVITHHDALAMQ
ncbi:hypothetical protein ABID23_000932 [Bartonella silvatica]|uniref:LysR family transcriptional regulator n=1 Tax=Bartonella silvatica TaxID=357760 RepID=A0ABV2HH21_9HYPH